MRRGEAGRVIYSQRLDSAKPGRNGQSVQIRNWTSPFFPALSFFETSEHTMHYGAHLHDTLEIIWTHSERSEFVVRDRRFRLSRGDVMIIAPNEIHAGGSLGPTPFSFASLHVPTAMIEILLDRGLVDAGSIFQLPAFQLIEAGFAGNIYHELVNSLFFLPSAPEQMRCLGELLSRLLRVRQELKRVRTVLRSYHPAIKRVQSIINTEFTEQIDFGKLANEVDLNQRYLISLFKSVTGIPPHQYQIALRVDLGRRLLVEKLPLSNVASRAGFADQSHFNRHFKRIYGITPGAFRDSINPLTS